MSNYLLERIPTQGITKEQHDRYVDARGKSFTDDWVKPHLATRGPDGGIVPAFVPGQRVSSK